MAGKCIGRPAARETQLQANRELQPDCNVTTRREWPLERGCALRRLARYFCRSDASIFSVIVGGDDDAFDGLVAGVQGLNAEGAVHRAAPPGERADACRVLRHAFVRHRTDARHRLVDRKAEVEVCDLPSVGLVGAEAPAVSGPLVPEADAVVSVEHDDADAACLERIVRR